jgi:hypothetical protein
MNNKNIIIYSSIVIAANLLLVVGGQGYVKIVSACVQDDTPSYTTGYNDAQNDYRDGKPYSNTSTGHYATGYSQGYIDARNGLYRC